MVNDFNFRNGIEMQYNPSSELDYDLFMRSSVNRTLSREAIALEREKTFMYDLAGLSEEEKKIQQNKKKLKTITTEQIPTRLLETLRQQTEQEALGENGGRSG